MTGSIAVTGYHDEEGDEDAHIVLVRHHQEEKHGDVPSADDDERSKRKNQNIHVSSTTTTATSPHTNLTSALPISNRNTINNHTVHPTGVLVATTDMIDYAQNYEECLSNNTYSCTSNASFSHHNLNDVEYEEDGGCSKEHGVNSRKRGLVSTDSLFSSSPPKKYFPRHSGGTAPPRRQYAVQEKSTSAASTSVTSENALTTNFNDNMDPRNSTNSSVLPFPAASPSASSSSSIHSTSIGASAYKNKHGTRRNSELLSKKGQPTDVVLPGNFHLRKSVSAAGQNLKGYRGGDNNLRSVGGDSCMENNEAAVPSPYAAQYSSNQPPFFDMVQHHPYYLVQPSSANSFTLLPSAATAVHHLPPNGFYYSSDGVSPQNVVGAPHANFITQHPDAHHSRRNSNSNGVQAAYHGEGRDISRSDTQVGVVLPNHQSNNGMPPLSAGFNSAIPHTGANQHFQMLYYLPHPSTNTSAGPFIQHDVVSPSAVGGYYVQMPSVANDHMVSPAPMTSHINHVTGDTQRVYPGTQFPPPPEYRLNHSYLPQQNQHNENNNATYFHTQYGSRTSQKMNFDQQLSNNNSHNDTKELANHQHHKEAAMDDGTAAGGPFHQPDDFATRKRILLTKLEEEKPRRPLTAYNFFFSEERERIIAEISSKNAEDDATNLDGSHPSPHSSPGAFVKTNEDNDDKITQAQTNINNGLEEMIRAKTEKLLSSRRQCDRPKRSHKKEHGKVSFQVLCTMVGKRWKALSDEQKQYYVDLSKKDIQRYRMDMKDYARKRARAVETFGVDDAVEK
eukprot:CAMPEP_0176493684 /NCGR_PEP_ID=MMETSP0200_2-20121128/9678_1 /TAXON_ID=947934 /ORGANISM="Chaetoceros sp., Strain GSL56" /LENGTH=787 /DNA_ID=CAMNT_0017891359 /DNA_START=3611 /DNA_END=5974 /DNA_ORIENTATION=+